MAKNGGKQMDESHEFHSLHLPHLINYVVAVMQTKNGKLEIGSGVLVKAGKRHFIATAKHCIDGQKVNAIRSESFERLQRTGVSGTKELRIIQTGWHENDDLDLGFLEITDPECAEMGWDQLSNDKIVGGMAQVVGYPEVLTISVQTIPGKLTDVSLCAGTFGTTLTEETEDRMTFDYPKVGTKYDPASRTWRDSEFPKTPRGFSGGAIFGVAKPPGFITQVEYKLLGIQFAWNESRRVVLATPIKRWKELLEARELAP
jgi:hypothetical protein